VTAPLFVSDEDVLRRIEAEYREMPGLRLTPSQAQRLWNLRSETCEAVLTRLVESKVLFRAPDGSFIRWDSGSPVR